MAGPLYRRLVRLLEESGCKFLRQGKGSHEIWVSPITNRHVAVPYDVSKPSAATLF